MEISIERNCILFNNFDTDFINYLNSLRKKFDCLNIVVYEHTIYVQANKKDMYNLLYTITNDYCEQIKNIN